MCKRSDKKRNLYTVIKASKKREKNGKNREQAKTEEQ